ncbi:MAG: hypothetical protein V7L01_02885 [Nostoc sp.]|uniref:hypothetical protein n=1 Tax=Nostoc sp. TaxID=1180 RepID=UPI002FF54A09
MRKPAGIAMARSARRRRSLKLIENRQKGTKKHRDYNIAILNLTFHGMWKRKLS